MGDETKWKPGVLNPLMVQGSRRNFSSIDLDASGEGIYRYRKDFANRAPDVDLFSGITSYKAIIVSKTIKITPGSPEWFVRASVAENNEKADLREGYRIWIPELHATIPNPCTADNAYDRAAYELLCPLAVWESEEAQGKNESPGVGSIVSIYFSVGTAAKRARYPIIKSVLSNISDEGDTADCPESIVDSFNGLPPVIPEIDLNSLIFSGNYLASLGISSYPSFGSSADKAAWLYAELIKNGLTQNQALGMVANARAESEYKSNANGDKRSNLSAGYVFNGLEPVYGTYCSYGFWQNNICSKTADGFNMLMHFTGKSVEDLKNYGATDEGKTELYGIMIDPAKQIEWAVKRANENPSFKIAAEKNGETAISFHIGASGTSYTGAEAATVWWLQNYEFPSGWDEQYKENERLLHLAYSISELNGIT